MNTTYLLLGSNMGNSRKKLLQAAQLINKNIGCIQRQSSLYVTAAWGLRNQPDFLNQVIVVQTSLTAAATLTRLLQIEKQMGRVRTVKNAPRVIDIDILFFNKDVIIEHNLIVPHPEIPNRRFVLTPLNEIAPQFIHPVLQQSIHQMLLHCPDKLDVKKF
jgi:2-amino-4-hydroxy-6-hydroxymethyldihydropteridine diphosphokinase